MRTVIKIAVTDGAYALMITEKMHQLIAVFETKPCGNLFDGIGGRQQKRPYLLHALFGNILFEAHMKRFSEQ